MIVVDVSEMVPQGMFDALSPYVMQRVMRDAATAAKAKWHSLAKDRLVSSEQDYNRGIQGPYEEPGMAWVELASTKENKLPHMIEEGFAGFDMRKTLLGPTAKGYRTSKEGNKYRSIMYRIGHEGASGRNFMAVSDLYAGALGEERGAEIGMRARQEANELTPTVSNPGEHSQWGGYLKERLTSRYAPTLKKGQIGPRGHALNADHKSDLFAGAYLFQQEYGKKTQTYIGTFRTISEGVQDGSWMHPGYSGVHLTPEVSRYMADMATQMVEGLAGSINKDV